MKILLAVTGGIAAYKACLIVTKAIRQGHQVRVMMTESATKFVSPLTFSTLSTQKVYTDTFESGDVDHVQLAQWADVVVVAPATANTIAKIAHGIGDNFVTTTLLAVPNATPILIAPAMNTAMWENLVTQANIKKLRSYVRKEFLTGDSYLGGDPRFSFIDPVEKRLACGVSGVGALASINDIMSYIDGWG